MYTLMQEKPAAMPPILSPAEVAGLLQVPVRTLGEWRHKKTGPPYLELCRHVRYQYTKVMDWFEAAFPGRIDLGIGRALGSDPVVTSYLRMTGTTSDVDAFPRNVADIRSLMHPEGAAFRLQSGQVYELTATPNAASVAELWLLGSSDYPPRLAAAQGMPYVFAHHFSGEGTERILGLRRDNFVPSDQLKDPRTFLTLNVSVAATAEEAYAASLPQLQQMARLRSGMPLGALATMEQAAATEIAPAQQDMVDAMAERWVIDEPVAAAARIRSLADRFGVDEVMVTPGLSAHDADAANTSPARLRALELLAEQFLP